MKRVIAILLASVTPLFAAACEEGDQLEVDIESGRVRNLTRGTEFEGEAYARDMLEIVEKGGLMKVLEERLGGRGDATQ